MPAYPEFLRKAFVYCHQERGKTRQQIAEFFGVGRNAVGEAIRRHSEAGTTKNRTGQGRKRSARDVEHRTQVENALNENNRTVRKGQIIASSTRKLAAAVHPPISRESVRWILKKDLGLKPYKDQERQRLTSAVQQQRVQKCEILRDVCVSNIH